MRTFSQAAALSIALVATTLTKGSPMAAEMPPGVERDAETHARLVTAYEEKGPDYVPRTHLMQNGRARFVNRLIEEVSPYLLQHAHNPVDWHPWSDATLQKAQELDRPIFLSVGYATCHWCHVMEEESFDNVEVAALLNRYFIPVKIDREAMPALDHVYITATQLQQGHAGWPNSVFLMPDGRPFHTGTYFPKAQFLQVVGGVGAAYASGNRRDEIEEVANRLTETVQRVTRMGSPQAAALGEEVMTRALSSLAEMHNDFEGGFSETQQFPQEVYLLFLLDHWRRTGEETALEVAERSLRAMVAGGLHDHAGGGFHRYTVDPNWRTPHFEKMLYNQALLSRAFMQLWEITDAPVHRWAAERTFEYVLRDMTDNDGAFYAAEDADSLNDAGEREEGAFYAWTPEQVADLAGEEAVAILGIDQPPTIEAGAVIHFDPNGRLELSQHSELLEKIRLAREARPRPIRDDKIIAGWNGLMIRALAEGGWAFSDDRWTKAAAQAGDAVWERLWIDGRLHRLWADGKVRGEGALEDHAWLALGYLALADATGEDRWTERATLLADAIWKRFADGTGRLRMSAEDGPLGPVYDSADGAVPSGESSALELFARLSRRVVDPEIAARAREVRAALSDALAHQPVLRPEALLASRILDEGETERRRVVSQGNVRVHLERDRLRLEMAPGWHVNANSPGPDWLIGARLDGAKAAWPDGDARKLGFSDEEIRLYEGSLDAPVSGLSGEVTLTIQTCSETVCLEPEELTFRLP